MKSLEVRSTEEERMDAANLDQATYSALLADLARVNTLTLSRRPTLDFIGRAVGSRRSFRLLDVGFGHGDMLRRIARWAASRGIAADLVGIDLNPRSAISAGAVTPADLPIRYLTGDYADQAGAGFDLVISNLVTHHMTDPQILAFLRFMEAEARLGWMVNDVHRHRFAHLGFPILGAALRWHEIVRHDGRLSIARGFRVPEWRHLLDLAAMPAEARIVRRFPFRLCIERLR